MKVSLEWLREYAQVDTSVADVVRTLVDTGTEVDRIHRGPEGVVVARITALSPVPKSTKGVQFADLDVGEDELVRVLTGAPNVQVGDVVPWARPGAKLPGFDKPLEVRTMLGFQSPGMLCSSKELGLSDEADGILILDAALPGTPFHEVVALDTVLDVEVTPNRPDQMCHLGLARELCAGLGETVQPPSTAVPEALISASGVQSKATVRVEAEGCRRFAVRVIEGVAVGPSPDWLQRRLRAIGLRPINNVVDVTNYVSAEMGQPLHAFDWDRFTAVTGGGSADIVVRNARDGEKLKLLDDTERSLSAGDMVVCAGEVVASLAGIMGGSETAVDSDTRNVLLESASWDGVAVRASSRRLGLRSDASTLFEKGLSDSVVVSVLDRAAALIADLARGQILDGVVDEWAHPLPAIEPIRVGATKLSAVLGYDVNPGEASDVLARLGFSVAQAEDVLTVTVPSFRRDVRLPEDIAEEVGRVLGYDRVPSTLPGRRIPVSTLAAEPAVEDVARDLVLGAGFDEAITWSFISKHLADAFGGIGEGKKPLLVRNPLSDDWSVMRVSQVPGLCAALATNLNYGTEDPRLFEIGRVYWEGERKGQPPGATPDGADAKLKPLPAEPLVLSLVLHAVDAGTSAAAVRKVEAILIAVAEVIGGSQLAVAPTAVNGLHPGRGAHLELGEQTVGIFGELAHDVTSELDLRGRVVVGELRLDALAGSGRSVRYRHPSRMPAIVQDLSVVVGVDAKAGDALAAIREAGARILEHAELYDEFRNPRLGDDSKGWTFRLRFRTPDKTLTNEEAKIAQDAIAVALKVRCGASVRI